MDFFERIFGVSPDGGDGSLEMLALILVLGVISVFLGRQLARRVFWPGKETP
jgi:hypothetical protein